LSDDVQFAYARQSDVNQIYDKRYFFVALDPLSVVPQFSVDGIFNYTKVWTASMAFYAQDTASSDGDEYKLLLDEVDGYVDKFINKLNFYAEQSDTITLSSIRQEPFIKATADILTGFFLTFEILSPNDFDYCEIEC